MRRRSAIEPVVGYTKAEHRMSRLAGQQGDALNATLAAAGYNFSSCSTGSGSFCGFSSQPSTVSRRNSKPNQPHCSRPTL
ncbi:hypothetical protein MesoLj131c_68170 (plasmid) [Mesorhizobium sp. 131-3-5]|nr:hypothetical protein MesoLj131c_68170 [Mesorhizobium sp. 131-3-5]